MKPSRYHPALVGLHWVLAVLILLSLGTGVLSLERIPNSSPDKILALRGHMVVGVLILALTLVRVAVRIRSPRPEPASAGSALLDKVALFTHHGLYVLVLLMAATGMALSVQADLPAIVFGGSGAPLPESFSIYRPRIAHGGMAKLLLALAALHVLAALYHQFVKRDGLLSRMWLGRR